MTGYTLFLIFVGTGFLTHLLFRVIDAIERPSRSLRRAGTR